MSVRLRLIIGIPFFALMFFYLGLRVYSRVALQDYSLRGWNAEWRDGRAVIADVIPNSPATGVLRKGDVVVAFWSERRDATPLVTPDYWRVPPGTRYKLTVSRDGQSLELPLQTTRIAFGGPSSGALYFFYMLTFLAFPTLWRWVDNCLLLTMPLIPLSFAYAIVRHQVIPISLIIRRGARYVFVSRGSIILGVLQAYDTRQIIADLTESLRTTTNLDQLLELVAIKVQAALQTANVTIFLRDEATGDYLSAYSCDYVEADGRVINHERRRLLPYYGEIVKQLSDNGKLLDIEQYISVAQQASDNGTPPAVKQASLPASPISPISPINPINPINPELAALIEIKSALLFPLSSKGEALGIVSLAPRLGDLPYSGEDEQLLMSVAGPAALAIENVRLVERMIAEAGLRQELEAENEIRAKELEEARQLQLSMLPQALPQLPLLEIAACMEPAAEVGGDYYDFHLSDDGVLTVAVGDATGHGLKAGTLVTATKSLFNHLAQESEIPAIFQQSSRALKRMNLRSLFMAMTIAKVNSYQMTLGSAGMPLLICAHCMVSKRDNANISHSMM
jgi:GAF domain-containing protein